MNVRIKRLSDDAVVPQKAHSTDAGFDLTATWRKVDGNIVTYGTDLAFEIPNGYVGLIFPRSSVYKKNLTLTNSVGVIDSGYRGEVMFKFYKTDDMYTVGERVGQMIIMPYPEVSFTEVKTLDDSERGKGGFGSSGN